MGMTNARVLPLPVTAWTQTSLEVRKAGMVAACTGVMSENPSAATPARMLLLSGTLHLVHDRADEALEAAAAGAAGVAEV